MKNEPAYLKIANDILNQIQTEALRPGDQLMTESQLCDAYGVSRMTVNKALTTLVARGLISRTAGKGSFVLAPLVHRVAATSASFSRDIESIGKKPGSILVKYEVVRAADRPRIMSLLHLEENDLLHYICRVRTGDGTPIAVSYTYIPCKILPALDVNALQGSLYEYLEREYGIIPRSLDQTLSAELPTREQLALLKVDSCAILKSSHLSADNSGRLFEYTETCYIGSRYTYHIPEGT